MRNTEIRLYVRAQGKQSPTATLIDHGELSAKSLGPSLAALLQTSSRGPSCGEAADSIRQELTACRAAGEVAMRRRFDRAKSEGDLPANVNPADLARYIATVLYGMAVQAAGGASRSKLQRVVEMALRTLPM
jgi:hypothetical protein